MNTSNSEGFTVGGREGEVREEQQYVGGKRQRGETEILTEEQIKKLK